jgi:hypothetical protein
MFQLCVGFNRFIFFDLELLISFLNFQPCQQEQVKKLNNELVKLSHNYKHVSEIPAYLIITARDHFQQALLNQNLCFQK